jgi:exosortase A
MSTGTSKFNFEKWGSTTVFLVLSVAAVLYFYKNTVIGLGRLWTDSSDFSHGWLMIPIFLWLVWNNRSAWLNLQPRPSFLGLLLGLLFGLTWLLGDIARVSVVKQLGIIGFIPAIALTVFGLEFLKRNLFAFLFVFFAVPAGEALNPLLMRYTAGATIWALQQTGIPVYREGLHFILPTGSWSVVDACSGLRYLICSLILGLLFAQLNYRTLKKKAIFIIICLVLAIVANWVRAYSVVMVGHLTQMKYGTGDDHVWYGWVFFGVMMMAIFWTGIRYGDIGNSHADKHFSTDGDGTARQSVSARSSKALAASIVFLGVISISMWAFVPQTLRKFEPYDDFAARVLEINDGKSARFPFPVGFSDPFSAQSARGANGSFLHVAYFGKQELNSEMFTAGNRLVREDQTLVRIVEDTRLEASGILMLGKVREYSVLVGNEPWVVWHWFAVDGVGVPDAYYAKAFRALSMLRRHGDHSVVLTVAQPGLSEKEGLRAALKADAVALQKATVKAFNDASSTIKGR